jgi:hypothetical protein
MNERLLIRASGVEYARELDLVVSFIEVIHNLFVPAYSSGAQTPYQWCSW